MRLISAPDIASVLDYPALIHALDAAFRTGATIPARAHHTVDVDGGRDSTLLLMPAWDDDDFLGVKIVCAVPENANRNMAAVQATYQLFKRSTGHPLALLDGPELTARRTASASALAAKYLAKADARTLLVVGTGVLCPHLVRAHMAETNIENILIWGRNPDKARTVCTRLEKDGIKATAAADIKEGVQQADIISTATLSTTALIKGAWLKPGQHLDLVGGFTPLMREADDDCIKSARVFVDTPQAIIEAGDICQPIANGALTKENIDGDLFALSKRDIQGRQSDNDITVFKSTGMALEDLAAAKLVYQRLCKEE